MRRGKDLYRKERCYIRKCAGLFYELMSEVNRRAGLKPRSPGKGSQRQRQASAAPPVDQQTRKDFGPMQQI